MANCDEFRWRRTQRPDFRAKLHLMLLFMSLFVTSAHAQRETFDIITFDTPPGYSRNSGDGYLIFLKRIGNEYCQIGIYASREGNGDAQTEFVFEWNDLIKKSTQVEVPASNSRGPVDGWTFIDAASPVKFEKGDYNVFLFSIIGHKRVTSVRMDVNTERFNGEIEKFFGSLRVESAIADKMSAGNETVAQQNNPIQQQKSAGAAQSIIAAGSLFKSGKAIVGVWRGIGTYSTVSGITNAAGTGYSQITYGSTLTVRQIAFFDDGTFCNYLPSDGLADYATTRTREPNYWGHYTFSNGSGTIQWDAATTVDNFKIENGNLLYDKVAWTKLASLHNWKFDGTFTAERNPSAYNGPEPTITFSANSRFDDHGAIYWLRHVKGSNSDMQDQMTGSGTYDIQNFTVTFRYDDGRLIRMLINYPDAGDRTKPTEFGLGGIKSFVNRK